MRFSEIVKAASVLLKDKGRVSYRMLQREFDLETEALEDLKVELIEVDEVAVDKDGKMLVWTGGEARVSTPSDIPSPSQAPASYTPSHLAERILAEQAAMESRGSADGERKTITALFADLKGSTALIEGLDPEDARAIIDPALQLMMDAVHRYDGYVAQALGDGIFALFGAPLAHEDHPQRALYAALRMQEEMRRYSDQIRLKYTTPLFMRVGVNTGEVVVRSIRKDDLHTDYVPVGHSTNIAARMEQMAMPGSIVISEYTRKLTEGYFELKALGAADIKGVEEPLHVHEVLGAGPLRTRLQVSARRGLTRFVGRRNELDQLQRALAHATEGHGQIVGVMGEPGLEKSRLFYEFVGAYNHTPLQRRGCLVLEAFSVSHGKASPYLPVIELLKTYFQIEPTDDERTRKEKIGGKVLMLDRSLEDTLPYLFSLLGIEDPQSSLQQMDAQIRRRRTFEALKNLFLAESLNQPLILVFEDLHWIDTETQGVLDMLTESMASTKLLLLVNYRPEYRSEWSQKTYYTQLHLAPLGKAEAQELLTVLLGSDPSLSALKPLILDKTDGTPFFLEEVVQTLAEEGRLIGERGNYRLEKTPTELHISPTVQGVLAARIDRLTAEEKELLQQLAVIGRQFPLRLLKQVVSLPEDELYRILSALQTKEFLYEQPAFPEVEYLFKHALTQEVAYGTLLHEQRKFLHEQTGRVIEELYRPDLEDHYSELALHYRQSGNTEKAVEYLDRAGQHAVQQSAYTEALHHLTAALALLKTLPDFSERWQQELRMQMTLGPVLIATKGYSAPEVGEAYARSRALSQHSGETAQRFPVLWGLGVFHMVRAEYPVSRELGEQLLGLAQTAQDSALLIEAYYILELSWLWSGEFSRVQDYAEKVLPIYDPSTLRAHAFRYGQDSGVHCLICSAWALWHLGYPDQAAERLQQSLTIAREVSPAPSLAATLTVAAFVYRERREIQTVWELAEANITFSTERGLAWLALGTATRGWAVMARGETEEGIAQIEEGLTAYRASGALLAVTHVLALQAEAYEKGGYIARGLATVAEALDLVEQTGERMYEAELYRLKGELLSNDERGMMNDEWETRQEKSSQHSDEAEGCFRQAIDIARSQQAKSWELRAATSLARLWQEQGKTAEARDLLAPVYRWFTEGFDTADLQDAKVLLKALGE